MAKFKKADYVKTLIENGYVQVSCHICGGYSFVPKDLVDSLILPYECNICKWRYNQRIIVNGGD